MRTADKNLPPSRPDDIFCLAARKNLFKEERGGGGVRKCCFVWSTSAAIGLTVREGKEKEGKNDDKKILSK